MFPLNTCLSTTCASLCTSPRTAAASLAGASSPGSVQGRRGSAPGSPGHTPASRTAGCPPRQPPRRCAAASRPAPACAFCDPRSDVRARIGLSTAPLPTASGHWVAAERPRVCNGTLRLQSDPMSSSAQVAKHARALHLHPHTPLAPGSGHTHSDGPRPGQARLGVAGGAAGVHDGAQVAGRRRRRGRRRGSARLQERRPRARLDARRAACLGAPRPRREPQP